MDEKQISIPEVITVGELANALEIPVSKVIAELMKNGVMATINEHIDYETAEIVSEFLGFKVVPDEAPEKAQKEIQADTKNMQSRPPVVAVLGHVDHGKTSLLDKIRETNVVAKESGGITQHIGAYQVEVNCTPSTKLEACEPGSKETRKVTFLDTPGHAAFEAMRQQGAEVTDIAIIIVAADDGIKPQTTEAIKHAKNAGTPMIVVINKIDKPDADPMRVKKQFSEIGMTTTEWGGDVEFVELSSKTGVGIDKLLEIILAMAEMMELKADPDVMAQGVVIESRMETGKGAVATVLIKNGTLRVTDWIQVGETYGRVKAMEDEHGRRLKSAEPSRAVRISGLKDVPQVSELMQAYDTEKEAIDESHKAQKYSNVKKVSNVKKIGIEAITEQVAALNKNELNIVVKADVVGSLDAIKESLNKCCNSDVGVKFVGEGVGPISESDIQMAAVSDKIIIGFKIGIAPGVDSLAKAKGVKIINYDVIYELIDDIKKILSEMMPMIRTEIPVGILKVLAVFKSSPGKTVVGGKVEDGRCEKDTEVHVKRGGELTRDYHVQAVQREKEEVDSVPAGTECGVSFSTKADVVEGDVLEFFRVEEHRKPLE